MKVKKLLDGTPINQSQFKKWIKALRSGEYKQTTGRLQSGDSYCCLGILVEACETEPSRDEDGGLAGGFPASALGHKEPWVLGINNDLKKRTAIGHADYFDPWPEGVKVYHLNDSMELSFDEIADCLEMVYVHGALE